MTSLSIVIHFINFYYVPDIVNWVLLVSLGEGNGTPLGSSCLENPMDGGAWWAAVHGVAKSRTQLSDFTFTFHFHALEKEMATHSSVLAWRIPGTGELGGLPSTGSHRVGHDWSDLAIVSLTSVFLCGLYINVCYSSLWNSEWQGSQQSVQFSCSAVSDSLWPQEPQHARHPCPLPTPRVHPNPCPLSQWCHPTISSFVIPSPPALNLSQHQDLFKWIRSQYQADNFITCRFFERGYFNLDPSENISFGTQSKKSYLKWPRMAPFFIFPVSFFLSFLFSFCL